MKCFPFDVIILVIRMTIFREDVLNSQLSNGKMTCQNIGNLENLPDVEEENGETVRDKSPLTTCSSSAIFVLDCVNATINRWRRRKTGDKRARRDFWADYSQQCQRIVHQISRDIVDRSSSTLRGIKGNGKSQINHASFPVPPTWFSSAVWDLGNDKDAKSTDENDEHFFTSLVSSCSATYG